jgi:hypothetical protein
VDGLLLSKIGPDVVGLFRNVCEWPGALIREGIIAEMLVSR